MQREVLSYFKRLASLVAIVNKILPESCTDVASVVSWYATAVDDDSEDNEACAAENLHYTEDKFDLFT